MKYLIGIDEAGRGPLAGPVAVGICMVLASECPRSALGLALNIAGINDSKKLSEAKREEIFELIQIQEKEGKIKWAVELVSEKVIDEKGISEAVRIGIKKCLEKIGANGADSLVLLDGLLKAPEDFLYQETIIKGDAKEQIISLASICAKVVRDRKIKELSKKYPNYGFDVHKGYGTKVHREKIKKFGLCDLHRLTFCKSIQQAK